MAIIIIIELCLSWKYWDEWEAYSEGVRCMKGHLESNIVKCGGEQKKRMCTERSETLEKRPLVCDKETRGILLEEGNLSWV